MNVERRLTLRDGIVQTGKLLTVAQASERLNVKERYIRHLIAHRRIDVVKIGRLVRIPQRAIDELMSAGYKQAVNE